MIDTAQPDAHPSASAIAGMAAMSLAMLLLPVGDAIAKALTGVLHPTQVAALRAIVQVAVLGVAVLVMRGSLQGRAVTLWTFASGQMVAIISVSLITAFQTMPIATAISIFFAEPLILTMLAGFLLGERPGPHRYAAIAVGMAGVLIILRPNFSVFGPVVFLPLLGAFAYALNMIITRKATRNCSPMTFQFGSGVFGALTMIAWMFFASDPGSVAPGTWSEPMVGIGILAAGALAAATFLLIAYGFSRAEASVLAPFQYLEILGATLVGYLFFGDIPDYLTAIGAVIVLGSGLYVFHRERKAQMPSRRTRARADR